MSFAKQKGKRGENEFCVWLAEKLNIDTERNYNQADGHSADVIVQDFIFEVKRREALDFQGWWQQVVVAAKHHNRKHQIELIPVVAFRQNRKPWEFLIPAKTIGIQKGFLHLNEIVFIEFAKKIL